MPTYSLDVGLTWTGTGGPGVNVWHVRTAGINPGNIDVQDASDAISTFYAAIVGGGFLPTGWRATGPAEAIDVATKEIVPITSWVTDPATGADTYSAPSMAVVGLRTSVATRSGRGRKFIGPLATTAFDNQGTLSAGTLTSLRNAANALVDSSELSNDWAVGVYSVSDGLIRDVVSAPVRDSVAVLRSRRD